MKRPLTILGYGSVARCLLPLLPKDLGIGWDQITIINRQPMTDSLKPLAAQGIQYVHATLGRQNFATVLDTWVPRGGTLVDLAVNIDTYELLIWCRQNNVAFLNASVEEWEPYANAGKRSPQERTLYHRQMKLLPLRREGGPTTVVDHGANPGLVSHFVKMALRDLGTSILTENPNREEAQLLRASMEGERWNQAAYLLGVKVIHISERDTQVVNIPREAGQFVNTWSVDGFIEEALAPAEMGWGTHEMTMPPFAYTHCSGPLNEICLAKPGFRTKVHSWVPSGPIVGMVIRHGEAFGISEHLSLHDVNGLLYRPTVHYAYCPCDGTLVSLWEWEMMGLPEETYQKIYADEIVAGHDELGVLLLGSEPYGWWTGSILDIHQARKLVPGQNATTVQVAAGLLGALEWILAHPGKGLLLPDELPWESILKTALPYLGQFVSRRCDWNPFQARPLLDLYGRWDGRGARLDPEKKWQFETFLVS